MVWNDGESVQSTIPGHTLRDDTPGGSGLPGSPWQSGRKSLVLVGSPCCYARGVRHVLVLLLCGGCFAGVLDANSRPAVTPKLSELPGDPGKRDAILDQANDTHGPEGRRTASKKQRKAETVAAFAAAIVGQAFSKTQNVTFGTATSIDEDSLFQKSQRRRPAGTANGSGSGSGSGSPAPDPTEPPAETGELLPWIKLK